MQNIGTSCNDCGLPGEPVPGQEDVYAWAPPMPPDAVLTHLTEAGAQPLRVDLAGSRAEIGLLDGIPPRHRDATPMANARQAAAADLSAESFLQDMIHAAVVDAPLSPSNVEYLPRLGAPWEEQRSVESVMPWDLQQDKSTIKEPIDKLPTKEEEAARAGAVYRGKVASTTDATSETESIVIPCESASLVVLIAHTPIAQRTIDETVSERWNSSKEIPDAAEVSKRKKEHLRKALDDTELGRARRVAENAALAEAKDLTKDGKVSPATLEKVWEKVSLFLEKIPCLEKCPNRMVKVLSRSHRLLLRDELAVETRLVDESQGLKLFRHTIIHKVTVYLEVSHDVLILCSAKPIPQEDEG